MQSLPSKHLSIRVAIPVCMLEMLLVVAIWPAAVRGHDEIIEKEIAFPCPVADVAATLAMPHHEHNKENATNAAHTRPCIVIVGGTMSHTRNGEMIRSGAPKRDALARLAHGFANKGYASMRYDKVGYGKSKPKPSWSGSYTDEAAVASAAISYMRSRKEFGPIAVIGESAGAYLACLAAKAGTSADAYVFLGGHCGPGEEIYEYNLVPLVRHANASTAGKAWIEKELRFELALGKCYKDMFGAAKQGAKSFEVRDGDFRRMVDLERRKEELRMPPHEMFRHIQTPVLAMSGDKDLNVPPSHAARIVSAIRPAGNHAATCVVLSGVDHSFQKVPEDEETRFRERYNFQSFRREYDPRLVIEVAAWLDKTLARVPTVTTGAKPKEIPEPFSLRGVMKIEKAPMTDSTPARIYLAPGIQIVEDITLKNATASVETLEGRIGPLLLGQESQAHFIDMPAGMYCEAHPHGTESIIYIVLGK